MKINRRSINILLLTLSVSVLLIARVIPHHHHHGLPCFCLEQCDHDSNNPTGDSSGEEAEDANCVEGASFLAFVAPSDLSASADLLADFLCSLPEGRAFHPTHYTIIYITRTDTYESAFQNSFDCLRAPPCPFV